MNFIIERLSMLNATLEAKCPTMNHHSIEMDQARNILDEFHLQHRKYAEETQKSIKLINKRITSISKHQKDFNNKLQDQMRITNEKQKSIETNLKKHDEMLNYVQKEFNKNKQEQTEMTKMLDAEVSVKIDALMGQQIKVLIDHFDQKLSEFKESVEHNLANVEEEKKEIEEMLELQKEEKNKTIETIRHFFMKYEKERNEKLFMLEQKINTFIQNYKSHDVYES
jgi:hypothetical protein